MWISYSDSEVNVFHPICEFALNEALRQIGKDEIYEVIHHQHTGNLEMDFCLQNKQTGKYLCIIEVKRSPSDIHSSRYQFQAMSYVQMNSGNNEQPFYILTNLEHAFAFRYDAQRPRVFQQILKPGFTTIGLFNDYKKEDFEARLIDYFKNILFDFINNRFEYLVTLEEFAFHIEKIKNNDKSWKSHLAVLLYEYIRGAFSSVQRNDLKDIRLFRDNIEKICNEAVRVNFKDIFTYSSDTFENNVLINNKMLVDLYDFGKQNTTGDSIAGLLHQIVSAGHEHEGEVSTDLELGWLVAELAKKVCGDIDKNKFICDPAAGSGNLISSAVNTFNLSPDQILVNDINPRLLELLSLRLGLNFAKSICRLNSPTIENKNIADLSKDFFRNVKAIVMNPPFVAGINCSDRKIPLFNKIKQLTNNEPISNIGQMPLEGVFLELITLLVPKNTTIACILPKTHLMARGEEAKTIRKIIIDDLGIHTIFTYPGNEIFDNVTKDTCVLVGRTQHPSDFISVISSYDKIPNIDIHKFSQALSKNFENSFSPIMPGIVARKISLNNLKSSLDNGWRELNSELAETIAFVKDNFETSDHLIRLSTYNFSYKRGTAGNSGASDLIFFDSRNDLFDIYRNIRGLNLKAGMRNAKLDNFDIGGGDTRFLDISEMDGTLINAIISTYLNLPNRDGKQKRKEKNHTELFQILEKEAKGKFSENAVLIPRNIRRNGRIYLSTNPVFVSTNFLVFNLPDEDKAIILSTWMTTIFYQMLCEISSKDQEGTRKMELTDILSTLVPNMSMVSKSFINKLKNEKDKIKFVDLQSPEIRNIDKLWANELFKEKADYILSNSLRLLEFLANRRNN